MQIKIYYRKNLKLSPQKLAAVCTHIGKELGIMYSDFYYVSEYHNPLEDKVVVLMASDTKFEQYKQQCVNNPNTIYHTHKDNGFTEVDAGTECAIGWVEEV